MTVHDALAGAPRLLGPELLRGLAPGAAPPALPLAPGPHSKLISCAWVPVGAPPPLSNLRVDKTALHGGDCYKVGPARHRLRLRDRDLQRRPLAVPRPHQLHRRHSGHGNPRPLPGAAGSALAGPPLACGTVGPVDIPVGGSITVPVTVTIPLAPLEAAGCAMPNTATITVPVGTDDNFFAGDDADTATADAFLFWLLPDGTEIVTCDPTNLKTTKVAKGDLRGFRRRLSACEYVVTVTNMGPDPYKGPIKISEQFGFAPNAVKFSRALGLHRWRREL